MPKLAEVLRGEIIRISRREARIATAGIREAKIRLSKTVADLKKKNRETSRGEQMACRGGEKTAGSEASDHP